MTRAKPHIFLLNALLALLLWTGAAGAAITPKKLLIYYSWPSIINGASTIDQAAQEFGRYDVIVLGDLLEKGSHPDHANTVAILAHPALAATTAFGYITLGVTSQNLSSAEIHTRIDEWQATGADGVILDEFGYEYHVTRERQNDAVNYAHSRGLRVLANAWVPYDAFGAGVDPSWNPNGLATALNANDVFLFESFQVQEGSYVPESFWRSKTDALEAYRRALGFSVYGVTTTLPSTTFTQEAFDYTWYSGLLSGYQAVGWGEYLFAALTAQAPFRTPPAIDPGTQFVGDVFAQSPRYRRFTNTGEIRVDAAIHLGQFLTGTSDVLEAGALRVWPNPSRGTVHLAWSNRGASDRSARILDASGRELLRLAPTHDLAWTAPRAGVYWLERQGAPAIKLVVTR